MIEIDCVWPVKIKIPCCNFYILTPNTSAQHSNRKYFKSNDKKQGK